MNSLRRMLDVMALITPDRPLVTVEEVCDLLGYAPASAYRYVRELTSSGFMVRLPTGYALGPRIIELDLQMRENDPLLACSSSIIKRIVQKTGLSVLLSELYEDKVITIHQESMPSDEAISFGRGRSMPLFRGATTRVILAHLPPKKLKRIYEKHAADSDAKLIGPDWRSFSKTVLNIRKLGYCLSKSELDANNAGIAAPIFDENGRVFGAMSIVGTIDRFSAFNEDFLVETILDATTSVTGYINDGLRFGRERANTPSPKSSRTQVSKSSTQAKKK